MDYEKLAKILSNVSIIRWFSLMAQFYSLPSCWKGLSKSDARYASTWKECLINGTCLVVINERLFAPIRVASGGRAGDKWLAYLRLARVSSTTTRCIPPGDIRLTIDRLSLDEWASLLSACQGLRGVYRIAKPLIACRPVERPRVIITALSRF